MHHPFQQEIESTKVLVIEDNKLFSHAIKSILELENIFVKTAYNGESAIDILTKENFDVILLDIMLGDKMNGFEFLNLLKSNIRLNHIPVIITSALVQDEKIYEGLRSGAIDYLVKPFRTNELVLKVKNFAKLKENHTNNPIISDINEQISNLDYDYQLSLEFISLVDKIVISGNQTTIKQVVKILKTNSSRLGIIVKKYHKTTPVKYMLIRRLLRANLMIRNSNISIIQIAEQCGFQTVTYFCTAYKRHYGKTPLKARKTI